MSSRVWLVGGWCAAVLIAASPAADAAPAKRPSKASFDVSILGTNDGAPYRLTGAAAEAVLLEPSAVIFQFARGDWLSEDSTGSYLPVGDLIARYPHRKASSPVGVYQLDVDGSGSPEMLLVPQERITDGKQRFGATMLGQERDGAWRPIWAADGLRGQFHRVGDVRDLNGDGRPEILLVGEGGGRGFYQFHQVIGRTRDRFRVLSVPHTDSVHYVDLEGDGRMEVVVRHRVGRRGPASQWTYVDHLSHWTGAEFARVDDTYRRYHDQETLPRLVGDLINLHEAKLPILEEKVEAIVTVRTGILEGHDRPKRMERKLISALATLQKGRLDQARRNLTKLKDSWPYDLQLLHGLMRIHAEGQRWQELLDEGLLALTVDPRDRWSWWWTGVALVHLEERSSAVASFHNLVRLTGATEEGAAFLKARSGEPGVDDGLRRVIEEALGSGS